MNGTITKRPLKNGGHSWGYSFFAGRDESGKRLQKTRSGFSTKREAAGAMRTAIAQLAKNGNTPTVELTFGEWITHWLKEYAARTASPKTLQSMTEQSVYLVRELGDMKLTKLAPLQVEAALHRIQDHGGKSTTEHPNGRPLAPKTARHIAFLLLKCMRKAVGLELISRVPISADYRPPKAVPKEPPTLDRERMNQLLQRAARGRFFALVVLASATGARRGELLALQWPDIDFETGVLNITKSLEETDQGLRVKSTKSGKPRRFAVPREALEALREHRREQDRERELFGGDYEDSDLVFAHPDGSYYKPDKVSVRITKIAKKAGLAGVGLHTLRHSHASELLSKGAPIPTVAKRLGHANANVTLSIYSHALEADELAAAKVWNDSMADVIEANRKQRATDMLADVSDESAGDPLKTMKQTA
ncbi:MAG TPA: tyrosine-type recombinase/integrase [Bryobacteraceae bacterium]|nr:tyrosine-type recombinase/integrase [Bryobacteraceae bacterium]